MVEAVVVDHRWLVRWAFSFRCLRLALHRCSMLSSLQLNVNKAAASNTSGTKNWKYFSNFSPSRTRRNRASGCIHSLTQTKNAPRREPVQSVAVLLWEQIKTTIALKNNSSLSKQKSDSVRRSLEPQDVISRFQLAKRLSLRVRLNGEHTSEWILTDWLTGAEEQRCLCAAFTCCRKRWAWADD